LLRPWRVKHFRFLRPIQDDADVLGPDNDNDAFADRDVAGLWRKRSLPLAVVTFADFTRGGLFYPTFEKVGQTDELATNSSWGAW